MIAVVLKVLVAYMLGSVSGSLLIGKLRHVDIRQAGSGNAGGTNAFRTQGFLFALAVVVIDIGKGALSAWLLPMIQWSGMAEPMAPENQVLVCGMAAVIGHCFPLWHGFRGGKGAATAVGAILVFQPLAVAAMLISWFLVLTLTGWVGLSTMVAAISLVPALIWLEAPAAQLLFAVVLAIFIIFMHRNNIRNMIDGTEYRFQRVMIRNWLK